MIQTILYATDLGAFSSHMLQHVSSLAHQCNARIILVHAVEPLGSFANAVVKTYLPRESSDEIENSGLSKMMRGIKQSIIDALADEYIDGDKGLSRVMEVCVEQGHPAQVILEVAKERHADLIIMGSHGPNAIGSNMIGSVTSKVLQLAKVPVYMVPMINPSILSRAAASDTAVQMGLWG